MGNHNYCFTLHQTGYCLLDDRFVLGINLSGLGGIERKVSETGQKLETLQQQLEAAKEKVAKPFAKGQELVEKTKRLAELNTLLNMDEKGSPGVLEAGETQDAKETVIVAENPRRPSVLGKLKEARERIATGQQKRQEPERKLEPEL